MPYNLTKLTLLYAENGRGKTTLCSALEVVRQRQADLREATRAFNLATASMPMMIVTAVPFDLVKGPPKKH